MMVRIITDSSSLYTVEDGEKAGIVSIPLCVSIGEKNFRDLTVSTPENITVINTRTLCGPHRYLVECARDMAKGGKCAEEIVDMIREKMEHTKSYLIPQDFDFLRRGGRLPPQLHLSAPC